MATITLSIRNNETGEIRHCKLESYWDGLDPISRGNLLYFLTEGNFSSDTNKHSLFFEEDKEPTKIYFKTGTTNAFTILDAHLPSGEVIKVERQNPECFGDREADAFQCIKCFFTNECMKAFKERERL